MEHIGTLSSSVVTSPQGRTLITYKVYTGQELTGFDYYYVQASINSGPERGNFDYYSRSSLEYRFEPVSPNSAIVEDYGPKASDGQGRYSVGIVRSLIGSSELNAALSYTGAIPGGSISATCDNRKTKWTVDIDESSGQTDSINFKPAALIRCGQNAASLSVDTGLSYCVNLNASEYICFSDSIICTPNQD